MSDEEIDPWFSPDEAKRRIAEEFPNELRACAELEAAARERLMPWSGRGIRHDLHDRASADEILAFELGRSTKTFRAAFELASSGFGEQAAMLNRSLFEGMAVAHWVHKNELAAEEGFAESWAYSRHLTAGIISRLGWELDQEASEAVAEATIEDSERLSDLQRRLGRRGDGLWTGHKSLFALVEEIQDQWLEGFNRDQLWQYFETVHRDNNHMLHASSIGLTRAFLGRGDGGGRVWAGPSPEHVKQALWASHWTYANSLTLFSDRFELTNPGGLREMFERHPRLFVRISAEDAKGVGRNDPCPCGSGVKFKKCHEPMLAF